MNYTSFLVLWETERKNSINSFLILFIVFFLKVMEMHLSLSVLFIKREWTYRVLIFLLKFCCIFLSSESIFICVGEVKISSFILCICSKSLSILYKRFQKFVTPLICLSIYKFFFISLFVDVLWYLTSILLTLCRYLKERHYAINIWCIIYSRKT